MKQSTYWEAYLCNRCDTIKSHINCRLDKTLNDYAISQKRIRDILTPDVLHLLQKPGNEVIKKKDLRAFNINNP